MVTPRFLTLSVASREISLICSDGDGACFVILLLPNKITSVFSSFHFNLLTFIQALTSAQICLLNQEVRWDKLTRTIEYRLHTGDKEC